MTETDTHLVVQTLAGDRRAADRLTARHWRATYVTAYHALGNSDDAQDVAQETLVYAIQRLSDLRERDKFASWLRHVTLSQCADYRRRRPTRRLGEPLTMWNEAAEEADYAKRIIIQQAVSGLSDAHRTTVLLHYLGGWSLEETAGLLHIPLNTVRSRLMAAKRLLRTQLPEFAPLLPKRTLKIMTTVNLSEPQESLIESAFPGARILSVQESPEPWMPFGPRVCLALADGQEKTVDFRWDLDREVGPVRVDLLPVLAQLGIPGPRLIAGPILDGQGNWVSLAEPPRGENLLLWTLGGTPHRIRLATERAFEAISRLQGITEALQDHPIAARLARRSLADEAETLASDDAWQTVPWLAAAPAAVPGQWRSDSWFADAAAKVTTASADIRTPLIYTDYLHFFPNFVRIFPAPDFPDAPLGWPGDTRMEANPLAEYVSPFGHFGDSLLGLAMVWLYDCYPFVHTGFVEQYLWRQGISRREFAPRLALRALQVLAREQPVARPAEGAEYWDSLHGYVEQGLAWM